jgi:hypothetical protein
LKPLILLVLIGSMRMAAVWAEVVEVELTLPVPAQVDLRGRSTVVVTPFLTVRFDGRSTTEFRDLDVQKEFDGYLKRILRRSTQLKVVGSGRLDLPTHDLSNLARDSAFWKYVGELTQADLILAGGWTSMCANEPDIARSRSLPGRSLTTDRYWSKSPDMSSIF